jgi:hypothetical protein
VKKLVTAIALSAFSLSIASVVVIAANAIDNNTAVRGARNTAIVHWPGGTNAMLVFINERLYPDTYAVAPIDDESATLAFAFGADASGTSAVDTTTSDLATTDGTSDLATTDEMSPEYDEYVPAFRYDDTAAKSGADTSCADEGCLTP